jgi:hypothetical protein
MVPPAYHEAYIKINYCCLFLKSWPLQNQVFVSQQKMFLHNKIQLFSYFTFGIKNVVGSCIVFEYSLDKVAF